MRVAEILSSEEGWKFLYSYPGSVLYLLQRGTVAFVSLADSVSSTLLEVSLGEEALVW